jgi:GNAT superfamily N-acetyltransferase
MKNITYKIVKINEIHKISNIDASQYIKRAWRIINGKRQLIDINYQSDGFPNEVDHHIKALEKTIQNDGLVLGAYDIENLIGFVSLESQFFGSQFNYVLLDQMFISKSYRNQGIGKKLMSACINQAKKWGADKIYICAGSAEDTIAFYKKLGCEEAKEINQELYESDIRDIQLEYDLIKDQDIKNEANNIIDN